MPPRLGARRRNYDYAELMDAAGDDRHAFLSLFDPDDPAFLHPPDMAAAIAAYLRAHRAAGAGRAGVEFTRAILESLAFKYRVVLDTLEEVTGTPDHRGADRRRRIAQPAAESVHGRCHRPHVLAGPVEATALGNIAMQMLATGAVSSLAEARRIIEHSFPVDRFEPDAADRWDAHYRRFQDYVELTCV